MISLWQKRLEQIHKDDAKIKVSLVNEYVCICAGFAAI